MVSDERLAALEDAWLRRLAALERAENDRDRHLARAAERHAHTQAAINALYDRDVEEICKEHDCE
jgi:predicted fused transcriptional regulator/phosphomethylpyrimidine kinase